MMRNLHLFSKKLIVDVRKKVMRKISFMHFKSAKLSMKSQVSCVIKIYVDNIDNNHFEITTN